MAFVWFPAMIDRAPQDACRMISQKAATMAWPAFAATSRDQEATRLSG
jgi:hypothetical protein